ncbi:MAG: FxLYD domain-containing protein [Thermodesulfobacteriota bacterium]
MKKYIFIIITVLLMAWGCDSPENDGAVALDGPILESVDSNGILEFNGAVINTGDTPVQSIYVVIVLMDESGNIIEANSTSIFEEGSGDLLYPSESVFFNVSVDSDPNRVFSKDVEIYYEDLLE